MRAIQAVSFLAFVLGYGGIENPKGDYQPVAIGIMFVSLLVLLVTVRKEYMHGGENDVSTI